MGKVWAGVNHSEIVSPDAYASTSDFEHIFTEDMGVLYLLSFLLTGDRDKAEECFVASIGECTQGRRIFKEWARSWARRTVIQSAIRLTAPWQDRQSAMRPAAARVPDKLPSELHAEVSAILRLEPLERFVFVMSTLERYSDHECSILLGYSRNDAAGARARGLQQLGREMTRQKSEGGAGSEHLAVRENVGSAVDLTIVRYFGAVARSGSHSQPVPLRP
jgi:DNA-directed RNA polymerase specialized sigma24 family protein